MSFYLLSFVEFGSWVAVVVIVVVVKFLLLLEGRVYSSLSYLILILSVNSYISFFHFSCIVFSSSFSSFPSIRMIGGLHMVFFLKNK